MDEEKNGRSRKKRKSKELSDEKRLGELAACVIAALNEESKREEEAFEHYALELRMRIYKDASSSKKRFVEGYKVLLSQLSGI